VTVPSTREVEARSYELDPYGHLNNAVYVSWLEHGRLGYLWDRGHSFTSIPETFGVHVVVVHSELAYKAQVRLGDRLRIETRIVKFGTTSFTFAQEIAFPDGKVAAEGTVTLVCVGTDGVPTPIPPDLRKMLDS
jgi:YbgC/YbaW family acyl-CoA thioester hydrolase